MGLGTFLSEKIFGPDADEERKLRQDWNALVEKSPDLARNQDEYNQGFEEYKRTKKTPTEYPIARELRIDSGSKTETPMPNGGASVQFPTTEVYEGSRPVKFGQTQGFLERNNPDQVIFPSGAERADKLTILNDQLPKEPKVQAYANYVDAKNGRLIRKEPIAGNQDQQILIGDRSSSGSTPQTAQEKADLMTLQTYHAAQKPQWNRDTGTYEHAKVDPNLEAQAAEAAQRVGIPTYVEPGTQAQTVDKDGLTGWLERVIPGGDSGTEEIPGTPPRQTLTPPRGRTSGGGETKVAVISPDGTPGMIPLKNLQKALSRGYKRAK